MVLKKEPSLCLCWIVHLFVIGHTSSAVWYGPDFGAWEEAVHIVTKCLFFLLPLFLNYVLLYEVFCGIQLPGRFLLPPLF